MEKTSVMVEFSIYGDRFQPSYITKELQLTPAETYIKGELTKNKRNLRKETSWSISTEYEASDDINIQLEKVMCLLSDKNDILVKLKHDLCVNMLFMVVIKIVNNETPAMYFRKEFIHFLSAIDAEIGFDVYVLS